MINQLENQKGHASKRCYALLGLLSLAILQSCSQDTSFSETTPANADVIAGKYRPVDTSSSQMEEGVLAISPYSPASQTFSLVNKITNIDMVQAGDDRQYTETYFQGARGEHRVETFDLMEPHKLDVLIMVDDSSSMDSYKAELGNQMESLLGHISNTNWRIGVITTTESCLNTLPKLASAHEADENTVYYLDKGMYDADPAGTKAKFKELVQQKGFRSSPNEQGIKTVVDAITGADNRCLTISNKTSNFWMREGSTKSVIMVTDESNCGSADGDACYTLTEAGDEIKRADGEEQLPWEKASYFTDNEDLAGMKVTFHGLFLLNRVPTPEELGVPAVPNDPCTGSQAAFKYPVQYLSLVQRESREGYFADVCEDFNSYDNVLANISKKMSDQVVRSYTVSQVPVKDADSIKVTVNGNRFYDFTVRGSSISFAEDSEINETGGTVQIDYYGLPETQMGNFAIRTAYGVIDESINVLVNNIPVDNYEYDRVERVIKFETFPSYGAKIDINYQDRLLHNKFAYDGKMMESTLKVFINGEYKSDIDVDHTNGVIITKNIGEEYDTDNGREGPPPAGSRITLQYNKEGERKVVYPADIKHKEGIRFKLLDVLTGEAVRASYGAAGIELHPEELVHNRVVKALFDDTLDEHNDQRVSLKFTNAPYTMDSMKVDPSKLPKACLKRLTISETGLDLICNNDALASTVEVPYSFAIDYKNAFDVTQTTKIIDEYTKFLVEVNGEEITTADYYLDGQKIVIKKDKLPVAAKVYIKALN